MNKAKTFILEIITPLRVKFRGRVKEVYLQAYDGRIGILANHSPLVAIMRPGILEAKSWERDFSLAVGEGFIKFTNNQATILARYAEAPDEVDVEAAKNKKAELEKEMSVKDLTSEEWGKKYWGLQSAITRLKVSEMKEEKTEQNV